VAVPLLAVGLWLALRSDVERTLDPARATGSVRIVAGTATVREAPVTRLKTLPLRRLEQWVESVPARRRERRGFGLVTLATDREKLVRAVRRALDQGGGTVRLPERPVAAYARLPIVRQLLRNNCETAALSMLLASRAVRVNQLELQGQLPRSGPLDPEVTDQGERWGDPRRGYVGRAEGGGTSGGYGVYEAPVRALAAENGVRLSDLSRRPVASIYESLLAGRPVMVWVGLSEGPYKTWTTPEGQSVTGNFGEHTVVLTGIRGQSISVNDPLVGERTTWTRPYFEELWDRLGRRALGT